MPIRAVIFDCFGVICVGSLDYLYKLAGQNWRQVQDLSKALDRGMILRSQFFDQVAPLVGMTANQLSEYTTRLHVKDEQVIELIQQVKQTHKTALLSNIGDSTIDEIFSLQERQQLFDVMVTSSSLGYCKPDVKIYQSTADKLGLAPEECLMVDDLQANVDGALAAGMQAIHFTDSNRGIKQILERLNA